MNAITLPRIDEPRRQLTALDRCDSCGAKAWVLAVVGGTELLFCAHHATQHLEALSTKASFIQDDRDQLLSEEKISH